MRIVDFYEAVGLLDENFFGEIWMTKEMKRLWSEAKTYCIAVPAPPGREHLQRLLLERTEVAKQRYCAGNIDKGEGMNRVRHERRDRITLGQGHQMRMGQFWVGLCEVN